MARVIEDVRRDTEQARRAEQGADSSTNGGGAADKNGDKKGGAGANGAEKKGELAVPRGVVEEALKATRECLEDIASLET